MTRKEQKMAKALHQISALKVTINQLKDMLGEEGEEVADTLTNAYWNVSNANSDLFEVISATGLHQALSH